SRRPPRRESPRRVARDGRDHHGRHDVGLRDPLHEPGCGDASRGHRRPIRALREPGLRDARIASDPCYSANVTESEADPGGPAPRAEEGASKLTAWGVSRTRTGATSAR